MEISTVIGIVLGLTAVLVGMVLKGANIASLLSGASVMIIFVGTAGALFNAFPMAQMKRVPLLFKQLVKKQNLISTIELVNLFVELSQTARREGLLALEGRLGEITDPFLKNGMSMMIDGLDPDFIRDVLEADVQAMEDRHRIGAQIFAQAGMYAPTLGVLGAVIGLIAALGNLNDIDKLGHAIAAAFVATMYGIFTGYVLWHPFANKLKIMSKQEADIKNVIIEGILSLQAGDSPMAVEAKLKASIPLSERSTESVAKAEEK